METINFPNQALLRAYLGEEELSQEGNLNAYTRLFHIDNGLVAKIYVDNPEMTRKNIVNLKLICERDEREFPRGIVLPEQWITLRGEVIGYTMRYVDGICLQDAMNDPEIPDRIKCGWFDRAAQIVLGLPEGLYAGDLHGGNILITEANEVCFIDIDGFSVDEGFLLTCPFPEHMEQPAGQIMARLYNKNGDLVISKYTDMLCLFHLFLSRYLGEINIFHSSYADDYMRYLRSVFLRRAIADVGILGFVENGWTASKSCFSDFLRIDGSLLSFDVFLRETGLIEVERNADQVLQKYIEGTVN